MTKLQKEKIGKIYNARIFLIYIVKELFFEIIFSFFYNPISDIHK
jgi:hypothetical protein